MTIAQQWVAEDSVKYRGLTIEEAARKVVYEIGETGQITKVAWMMEIEKAITAAIEEDRKLRECCKQERQRCMEIMRDEVGEASFNDPFSREGELVRRAINKIRARSESGEGEKVDDRNKCIMLGCKNPVASPEPFTLYCVDHKP
jgi:hypothetical protein